MNSKQVSIIIVNYNTKNLLLDCISSVKEKTQGISYEIIVVDNASSDQSVKALEEKFPEVNVISSRVNLGFGKANNLGAKIAKGKYLFLLNTDTLLMNNAIKFLYDFMEKQENHRVAACGGNLYHLDGSPNFSYTMQYPSLGSHFLYKFHLSKYFLNQDRFNHTKQSKEVNIIIGADLFIRKSVFDELGGFDENFFMYVEEGELQYRMHQKGWKIYSVPDAEIVHMQGSSSTNFFKLKTEFDSYQYYFTKHFGDTARKIHFAIENVALFFKFLLFSVLQKKQKADTFLQTIKYIHRK